MLNQIDLRPRSWLPILICLLPMLILLGIRMMNIEISRLTWAALVIACPITHFVTMRYSLSCHEAGNHSTQEESKQPVTLSVKEF